MLSQDCSNGKRPLLKICDFGFSKVLSGIFGCNFAAKQLGSVCRMGSCHGFVRARPLSHGQLPWRWWRLAGKHMMCVHVQEFCHSTLKPDVCTGSPPLSRSICERSECTWSEISVLLLQHEANSGTAKTSVGTPIYMAPEIIYGSNRYDAKVKDQGQAARASGMKTCHKPASRIGGCLPGHKDFALWQQASQSPAAHA